MNEIPIGMTEKQFDKWKKLWFDRIPKCGDFYCVHESTNCAIYPLCGCGSIYETYKSQEQPMECATVTCEDCFKKFECKRYKKLMVIYKRENGIN